MSFLHDKIRLISSDWLHLPPGGDDRPTLSWLPLRPHRVLGLPPAVRLPSGWLWGRPPSRSRRRSIFTPQNQGGAERRRSQEEGQESRVGRRRRRAAPVKLRLTRPRHGLHMMGAPIPLQGKGQFELLPNETLSIRAKWCFRHFTQHEDSVNTTANVSHLKPTWTFSTCSFLCLWTSVLNTVWWSTCSSCMGLCSTSVVVFPDIDFSWSPNKAYFSLTTTKKKKQKIQIHQTLNQIFKCE